MTEELPESWARATVEELCELNPKHPNTVDDATEVSFVPMAAVTETEGRITGVETRKYGEVKKGYTHFADGDVIFAKITPCMENGKAASVRGLVNGLACGTTEFFVFRSRGAVDQDYLFHFIRQESYRRAARATMQSGVGQARVPKEFVLNTELPLPPLTEQRRIVAKIEELTARSRAARAALAEVPTLLERFRQSVLASAFRGDLTTYWREKHPDREPASVLLARIRDERRKRWEAKYPKKEFVEPDPVDETELPELPEGWCWTTIEETSLTIVDCPHSTPAWTSTGRICVRTTEFRPGVLDLQAAKFVSEATFQERVSRLVPQEGDVLYSREGGILGIAVMIPPNVELCLGQRMMLLRADHRVLPALLMHWLNSPVILDRVRGLTTGSASPHLNVGDVKQFPIPLMPTEEQAQVVSQIKLSDARRTLVGEMVAEAEKQLQRLDQSILAKAFRGELVSQDPADEPASVLLERIRSGGSATTPATPTRSVQRGQVKFYILLLLRTWNKPLGREMLERGLVLMLNADVRRAILGRSKPASKRTKKRGTPPRFVVGMDALLGEMLDDGQLVPGPEAGFFAEGQHGADFAAAPKVDLDAVREAAEAMKVLHKDKQQATDAEIVSALNGEIYELVP